MSYKSKQTQYVCFLEKNGLDLNFGLAITKENEEPSVSLTKKTYHVF